MKKLLYILILITPYITFSGVSTVCHNDCNHKGYCTSDRICKCFDGWEGNDCTKKSCPLGPQIAGVPMGNNSAHQLTQCSGQGSCDYANGNCKCNPGFSGMLCNKLSCLNECSNHGQCVSLRKAAPLNDGYHYNRTTTYDTWDADVFNGCKCDVGWSGADCSQRTCQLGLDPRLSNQNYESIYLVCSCNTTCSGKFKLRYKDEPIGKWLYTTSTATDVASALSFSQYLAGNYSALTAPAIFAYANSSSQNSICKSDSTITTKIIFYKNIGKISPISTYSSFIVGGQVFFETRQIIQCDCLNFHCNGTFRLSFDGEISNRLLTWTNGSEVESALRSMSSIQTAQIYIKSTGSAAPICKSGSIQNHTIVMHASFGSVPTVGLWSSVVQSSSPAFYSSVNSSSTMRLTNENAPNSELKLCNGIGKCNFDSGICDCPFGWTFDSDLGPCGRLVVNSSSWPGVARCPGVLSYDINPFTNSYIDDTSRQNYPTMLYFSTNPTYREIDEKKITEIQNVTTSIIYRIRYGSNLLALNPSNQEIFLNLTSNFSAGPLILDQAKEQLIYYDANPYSSFLGIAPLFPNKKGYYSVWIHLGAIKVYGLAMDTNTDIRKVYWSVPGTFNKADGNIFWAYVDDTSSPVVYSLSSVIGQQNLIDPKGLAIHYVENRIYWVDNNASAHHSVLRSCNFDGSEYKQVYLLKDVGNHSVSMNATDLVIDFQHNDTAFIIDSGATPAIVALNLNSVKYFDNSTEAYEKNMEYYDRTVVSIWQESMKLPDRILLDDWDSIILWSDLDLKRISYARLIPQTQLEQVHQYHVEYQSDPGRQIPGQPENYVVGMVFDRGFGTPRWGNYMDCYGHGVCDGLSGASQTHSNCRETNQSKTLGRFICNCDKGYYGDCQAKRCPLGPAWFSELTADNIGHDEFVECSNMGVCDRDSGICTCRVGFEGNACERWSCFGKSANESICSGRGRCLSMRNLAKYNKNEYLEPSPVQYGSIPIDPTTWDADMIFGCLADDYGYYHVDQNISSYTGPNLEFLHCPTGYRMSNFSSFEYLEVQNVQCLASSGSFTLSFRGLETVEINANISVQALQKILEEVQTIGKLMLTGNDLPQICSTSGSNSGVNVTFLSTLGQLPLIKLTNNNLYGRPSTVNIVRVNASSNPNFLSECSGHGSCNTQDNYNYQLSTPGECQCWDNWGTSDGFGGTGNRGDCGYYITG